MRSETGRFTKRRWFTDVSSKPADSLAFPPPGRGGVVISTPLGKLFKRGDKKGRKRGKKEEGKRKKKKIYKGS